MRIDVITLFPRMVEAPLSESIVGRARKDGFLKLNFVNPRDFTEDRHKTVDDRPYGGGAGMIMMAEPVYRALEKVKTKNACTVLLSPAGMKFSHETAVRFSGKKHLILICGRYEGIDERISKFVDIKLSIGDYVLTGGEPAAVAVIDAVTRLLPGVLKKKEAVSIESFVHGFLESPQYTRPRIWRKLKVPEVLLSGNHESIAEWRRKESLKVTRKKRPDLLKK
ncbi:MAG: tRNA (guanosine(37)-N1)-methyltransferase TrmD [Elusimicrobia bacterium]|nr:tRNA (guanosine(37)-N1)-methyltransferase TrmD [Elusimicrobiota bacterium]